MANPQLYSHVLFFHISSLFGFFDRKKHVHFKLTDYPNRTRRLCLPGGQQAAAAVVPESTGIEGPDQLTS